jgi:hypothetical protein
MSHTKNKTATQKLTIAMERSKSHPAMAYLLNQRAFCNSLSDDRRPYTRWFDKTFGPRTSIFVVIIEKK